MNEAGQVVFEVNLRSLDGLRHAGRATWLANGIDIIKVAASDQQFLGGSISIVSGHALNDRGEVAYSAILKDNRSAVALFSVPQIRWAGGDGSWTTNAAWTSNTGPTSFHEVVIDADAAVIGPVENDHVKSLIIGSNSGS